MAGGGWADDVLLNKKRRSGDALFAVVIVLLVDEGAPELLEVSRREVESHEWQGLSPLLGPTDLLLPS